METDPEILAAQEAYEARPFAVRWVDSHFAGTFRFHTYDEAFDYIQDQWKKIRNSVATRKYRASHLWESYLITPTERISVKYVLLAEDVSSY